MNEVGRGDQVGVFAELLVEVVKHQHPPTQPPRADLEAGPIGGEGVGPDGPGPIFGRRDLELLAVDGAVLAVVEDDLEQPIAFDEGSAVAVLDPLEVALRLHGRGGQAWPLLGRLHVHAFEILGLVLVDDDVAAVVVALLEQPRKHPLGIPGIGHARVASLAKQARDIIGRDRPPVDLASGLRGPALDPRKAALDPRAKAVDQVPLPNLRPDLALLVELVHEILNARQHEGVAPRQIGVSVTILGQALVGLARDRGHAHHPAQSKRAVAEAGIVAQ
ncbi:MAG: hypothetical protein R6X02_27710 [Enhygromyxa sp.]